MATTIDLPRIKQEEWTTTSSYNSASIISYNIALGVDGTDLSRCFEGHPNFHALPTFGSLPVISAMGLVTRSMAEFLPNFQGHNHVHGEHYLELRGKFPKEATLRTTAKVIDIVDKKSGVTVCVGITTYNDASGAEICYNEWTSFVMKVPGAGASQQVTPRGAMTAVHPPPNRAPTAVMQQLTSPEQGALYRAASGDLNPLHIDPKVAKAGGFPGPILTGTCTMGMGVKHVIDTFAGGDSRRFKSLKLRLSKPVFPGEKVITEMWREDDGRKIIYRQLAGEEKRVAMSMAAVELWDYGKSNL
jgi:peroxisomal enoyl-CoA hydratase 2